MRNWLKTHKLKAAGILSILFLVLGFWALYAINGFFETYQIKFQNPIQKPVWIERRPVVVRKPSVIYEAMAATRTQEYTDPIDQMIYKKFGADGDLAVAISRAENGTHQCDRIVVEPDGTVSIGLFMINSRHFDQFPVSQLVTCEGNLAAAAEIANQWGNFEAWSAYNNGSYKKFLK